MEAWPLSLQQHLNTDSFGVDLGDTLIRSDMDVGPAKLRSRFTQGIDDYSASINLDIADYNILTDFYKTTLNNGVLPFTFTDPLTNTSSVFRFRSPPKIVPLGGRTFQVSLNWELLP